MYGVVRQQLDEGYLYDAEATGLGCYVVVINPRVLSANKVDFGFFMFHKFPPPLPKRVVSSSTRLHSTA